MGANALLSPSIFPGPRIFSVGGSGRKIARRHSPPGVGGGQGWSPARPPRRTTQPPANADATARDRPAIRPDWNRAARSAFRTDRRAPLAARSLPHQQSRLRPAIAANWRRWRACGARFRGTRTPVPGHHRAISVPHRCPTPKNPLRIFYGVASNVLISLVPTVRIELTTY